MTIRCTKLEQTFSLGREIGALCQSGDIISLKGPLGVGKTQLAHGIVRGYLGKDTLTNSPSYAIANLYENEERYVYHIDLYRLNSFDELESTGYWDMIEDNNALIIIEWLDQVRGSEPLDYAEISLRYNLLPNNERGESAAPNHSQQLEITRFFKLSRESKSGTRWKSTFLSHCV